VGLVGNWAEKTSENPIKHNRIMSTLPYETFLLIKIKIVDPRWLMLCNKK
jgi:hypothetical protein